MGMYTELVLNVELKKDTPPEVISILEFLANRETAIPVTTPKHEFFECDRWLMVASCSSYHFTPFSLANFQDNYLSTRFDLKNYDSEIEKFVDWLTPYLDAFDGDFLGYKRYEEDDMPTLLLHPNVWVPTKSLKG